MHCIYLLDLVYIGQSFYVFDHYLYFVRRFNILKQRIHYAPFFFNFEVINAPYYFKRINRN